MSFEPQKFFIGLMEFFTILLPGAFTAFLFKDDIGRLVLGNGFYQLSDAAAWGAFLALSYVLGHFIFLIGSWLDEVYDWMRSRTLNTHVFMLAWRGQLPSRGIRMMTWLFFGRETNRAVSRTGKLRNTALKPLGAGDAINAFQWSKALLAQEAPEALEGVHRFEADSKFFRSFAVTLMVLTPWWAFHGQVALAGAGLAMLALALIRYAEQRHKATNEAYWSVLTLAARKDNVELKPASRPDGFTHAGGVVYREHKKKIQYLLLEAADEHAAWVLPKGHIEDGEHLRETAVREVMEEAHVWAKILTGLPPLEYIVKKETIKVRYYLMRYIGRRFSYSGFRRRIAWFEIDDAIKVAEHDDTKRLLVHAEAIRKGLREESANEPKD